MQRVQQRGQQQEQHAEILAKCAVHAASTPYRYQRTHHAVAVRLPPKRTAALLLLLRCHPIVQAIWALTEGFRPVPPDCGLGCE